MIKMKTSENLNPETSINNDPNEFEEKNDAISPTENNPSNEFTHHHDNENEPFNPYEHRNNEDLVSNFESWANLVKSAVGTGLFTMPNAFACVGLPIGIIGTILIGFLTTTSLQFLVQCHYKMCVLTRKGSLSYDEVVSATLATGALKNHVSPRVAKLAVDVIMVIGYIGVVSVYIVFISGIIQECIDPHRIYSQSYYTLAMFPLFLLMNMVKTMKILAPFSICGNISLASAALIGIVYALKDGIGDTWTMLNTEVKLYPQFLGTVFFSVCSPGLVIEIIFPWFINDNLAK